MRLINGTILVVLLFHAAAAQPLEDDHQLTTTTHGHITARADPVGPSTPSITDSPKPESDTTSPAGEARVHTVPDRVILELITDPYGYYVALDVGTPAKKFLLHTSTGSSDTWITSSGQQDSKRMLYDPEASTSAERIKGLKPVPMVYQGDFPGESTTLEMYTDTVTLDDLTIQNLPIGAAHIWSDHKLGVVGDGILGLGLPLLSLSGQKPFFSFLVDEGLVPEPCFSVKLVDPFAFNHVPETSTLTLGGFDPAAIDGEFTDLEVRSDLHWLVEADSIFVRGVPAPIATHVVAMIDTGSSVILGDLQSVRKLHRSIPGSREDSSPEQPVFHRFIVPCTTTVTLTVVFAGQRFPVSELQLVGDGISELECWSTVVALVDTDTVNPFWVLGLPFLRTVYTKFTLPRADGAPAQVSFAKLSKQPRTDDAGRADPGAQEVDSDDYADGAE